MLVRGPRVARYTWVGWRAENSKGISVDATTAVSVPLSLKDQKIEGDGNQRHGAELDVESGRD